MIARIPTLKYLDDRPVFDEDRRYAEAFYKGGMEAEREERKKYKKEQEDKHLQNHLAFKAMIERARQEGQACNSRWHQESRHLQSVDSHYSCKSHCILIFFYYML